jgi:hypothetical protein
VVDLPLVTYHVVGGRAGRAAVFSRLGATVSGQAVMRFAEGEPGPVASSKKGVPASREPDEEDAEPGGPGSR